jgi:hypothetical protein
MKEVYFALIGLVTTVGASIFSSKLTVRQMCQSRWWERKERAYTEIIEALYDLLQYSSLCADEYINPKINEHPKKKEYAKRYLDAYWRIQKMTDIGPFVISQETSKALDELRDKPKLNWDQNPPWEIYEEDALHYREALKVIKQCAKRDLKV